MNPTTPIIIDEESRQVVASRIEHIAFSFIRHIIHLPCSSSSFAPTLTFLRTSSTNTRNFLPDINDTSSLSLCAANAHQVQRMLAVLAAVHELVITGRRMSQRELYYALLHTFRSQRVLNDTLLRVSALVRVPRYALHVGAATRGVVAGCLRVAVCTSHYVVDCRHVGCQGWPIPGDIPKVTSLQVESNARYILVIEKFGIFTRLVEDRFFDHLPSIIVCGKGYPSISTRAMVTVLESTLRLPVLGLADFNPHGLQLLQCYRFGSARSSIEGHRFVCNLRWLGLRASQIRAHDFLGTGGTALTSNDNGVLNRLKRLAVEDSPEFQRELADMEALGKFELQWLYGHPSGLDYFSQGFVKTAILTADYL